ncbi:hydroxyisourate hydrolase [Paenibacillus piscarius]|uniref:hydroxyisourate hydrolase n=1 Tax=Paenibacillus piscarius TaxID=1089681 RepID=UPI003B75CE60
MNGRLTTHVLDLSQGKPAAGLALQLWRLDAAEPMLLRQAVTNEDGRLDAPLLSGEDMQAGTYEIVFMAGDYFRGGPEGGAGGQRDAGDEAEADVKAGVHAETEVKVEVVRPFLDRIPIRFNVADRSAHYHVPLLVAPGGYSTYRGS